MNSAKEMGGLVVFIHHLSNWTTCLQLSV